MTKRLKIIDDIGPWPKTPPLPPSLDPAKPGADTTVTIETFRSGARITTVTGRHFRMAHLEGPYHPGDIIDILLGKKP